ncbi:FadR/GntR family transcriptional regulator [Dactylosporangium sucinum]|uniref:GntR family transcriptional regulator n=1 Tax=Dactylosporangium sucinum TaxID=1424081 RepID=A0A917SZ12_9ACTN|nr:FCD domain-containing protein [Dactylosporangium sucinum]GGM04356.1 GntR family transcriptional regulator [Dactylosporangium sucinum]
MADDRGFVPVRGGRLHEDVVDQITYAVRRGRYRPGDRLPSIDDLAVMLGTSRPTVREAITLLADAGVVTVRRGHTGGIVVATAIVPTHVLGLSRTGHRATLAELTEARHPVEQELARLAGQRATEENFSAMAEAIAMLGPARGRPAEWVRANDLFHYEIARAARSPRLALYSHQIMEELAILLDGFDEQYTDYAHTVHIHEETLRALRSRDPGRIAAVMDDHLGELEET